MKQKLVLEDWERHEHFNFFNQFEESVYGVCVSVDCANAYQFSKANGVPFFLYYLHKCLVATNEIEAFNAGATVARDNGTFRFSYFCHYDSIENFVSATSDESKRVKKHHRIGAFNKK